MGYLSTLLDSSPAAVWLLGDSSGSVAVEYLGSPFAADGSFIGSPTLGVAGIVATGSAVQTGASSYVRLPMPSLGDFCSFAFVFEYVSGGGKILRNASTTGGWALDLSGTNPVLSGAGSSHTFTGVTSASLKDGDPHHVVMTWNASTVTLYLDGVSVGSFSGTTTGMNGTFYLGKDGLNATFSPAKFAAAAAFSGTLGAPEVAALYAARGEYKIGAVPVSVVPQALAASFPSITVITVTPQALPAIRPVLTQASLVLSSSSVSNVVDPVTAPGLTVEPLHIVSNAVPAPTLVDGRPT